MSKSLYFDINLLETVCLLDKRNKAPNVKDYVKSIGRASWEINVGKGTKYTDVPPYGQSDTNLQMTDFLNQ